MFLIRGLTVVVIFLLSEVSVSVCYHGAAFSGVLETKVKCTVVT